MTTTVRVVQRRHMFSPRRRPVDCPPSMPSPRRFPPRAAIRLSLAHIAAQVTAGCIAARMDIGQAGLDGTAQASNQPRYCTLDGHPLASGRWNVASNRPSCWRRMPHGHTAMRLSATSKPATGGKQLPYPLAIERLLSDNYRARPATITLRAFSGADEAMVQAIEDRRIRRWSIAKYGCASAAADGGVEPSWEDRCGCDASGYAPCDCSQVSQAGEAPLGGSHGA